MKSQFWPLGGHGPLSTSALGWEIRAAKWDVRTVGKGPLPARAHRCSPASPGLNPTLAVRWGAEPGVLLLVSAGEAVGRMGTRSSREERNVNGSRASSRL